MDGKCAGAIVRRQTKLMPDGCSLDYPEMFPINYKDDFPFDKILPNEEIIIVDFSLQKEGDFANLYKITKDITWIDHHKTAINKHIEFEHLAGIRSCELSGCELTWQFFNGEMLMPEIVSLLGDYDMWKFKYGDKTNWLQTGIKLYDTNPESLEWDKWFKRDADLTPIFDKGKISLQYRDNYYKSLIKGWSFYTEFEGYKVIACNAGCVSSQLFDSVDKNTYDLMMPFIWDGKQWTISIYTTKDIDCSLLAKKYGGGGHKKAAGFQCKKLPYDTNEVKDERTKRA